MLASRGKWKSAPHLTYLSLIQTELFNRRIRRLIIQMPPRHGKSSLTSHYFPAWWMGNAPDESVILASHQANFAASWGQKARDTFREFAPSVFRQRLHAGVAASSEWGVAGHDGRMRTAGAGGSITGKGADLLIVDDPIKNADEASSAHIRDKQWDWWLSVVYTRLEPRSVACVIQTRWHDGDLAGRLIRSMKDGGEHWTVVSMPAIADHDETWRFGSWSWSRKKGEALWPERYPAECREFKQQKRESSYTWAAMYQQRPQPDGGGIFKREHFRYCTQNRDYYILRTPEGDRYVPKDSVARFMMVDPAASLKTTADPSAIGHFGVTLDGDLLWLETVKERMTGPEQVATISSLYDKWRPGFVGVETVSYQLTLFQHLVARGLPVKKLVADRDKVSRGLVLSARMLDGKVYFLAGQNNQDEVEQELLLFPRGDHDDVVDIGSYAAIEVTAIHDPQIRSL